MIAANPLKLSGLQPLPTSALLTSPAKPLSRPARSVAPGDSVDPGKSVVYNWKVTDRAGPGQADMSSVIWMYHSHGEPGFLG